MYKHHPYSQNLDSEFRARKASNASEYEVISFNTNEIIDKVVFDFDPRINPEKGRVKFILTSNYIQNLIKGGENEVVEFKGFQNILLSPNQKDDLTETFVSFANIKGGIIIVGVKDDKTIIGFNQAISIEEIKKTLVNIIYDWCDPYIVNENKFLNNNKYYEENIHNYYSPHGETANKDNTNVLQP